ncbi:hypothetical protein BK321_20860 [Escherichia coli]|nr:hypothetical protein BK321_20860 [Escherichia coli]
MRGGCRQLVEYATVTLTLKITLDELYLMSKTPVKTQLHIVNMLNLPTSVAYLQNMVMLPTTLGLLRPNFDESAIKITSRAALHIALLTV